MNPRSLLLNAYVYAVLAFILLPILVILPMAFSETTYLAFPPQGLTLRWFEEFFGDRRWMAATWFSVKIAALTAVTTAVVGTMATYALVRGARTLGTVFQAFLIGPIVVPHIALAVALYLFFQNTGLSGTVFGYVAAHSIIAMPFVVFTVAAALSSVDPALEDAAMSERDFGRAVCFHHLVRRAGDRILPGRHSRQDPAAHDVRRHRTEPDADHPCDRGSADIAFDRRAGGCRTAQIPRRPQHGGQRTSLKNNKGTQQRRLT
jgi:hypothetical protein